jgi:putative tryptophan/tyrosine transport system substrate-binding protein
VNEIAPGIRCDVKVGRANSTTAWPLAVCAQQIGGRPRRIGVLGADATIWRPWIAAFTSRLRELGWIEGETVAIDYRWGEYVWVPGGYRRSSERVSEVAAELLRQNVDVILSYGSAVASLKQATTTIPIVSLPSHTIRSATSLNASF